MLFGCGRIGFDATRTAPGDGNGSGDGTQVDAPSACAQFGSFNPPVKLPAVLQSGGDDWDATPSDDGRLLYFYTCGPVMPCALYFATRASVASAYGPPIADTGLAASAFNQVSPTLSRNGLAIIYASDSSGQYHLMRSERASTQAAFGPGSPVLNVNSAAQERDSFMTANGLRLVFLSTRGGGGLGAIYEASRDIQSASFGTPRELVPLNTAGTQISPTLSADGLEIFFSSNRGGGLGGFDIYRSHRTALSQPFDPPTLVPELSSAGDDLGVRLTEDGATMYLNWMTSAAGGTNTDLYVTTRGCI